MTAQETTLITATVHDAGRALANASGSPVVAEGDIDALAGRFGRSRFLKAVGSTLFTALAFQLLKAQPALAHTGTPPACCGPSGKCNCCSGDSCCGGCTRRLYECNGEIGGWYCCIGYSVYFCKDWWDSDGHACICAKKQAFTC